MILRSKDNKVFKTASAALFDKRSETEVATINDIDGVDDFMAEIGESDINPSLALTPNGSFKEGKLLSVLPFSGGGDFTVTGGGNAVSQRSDGTWQINWPANTPRFSWNDGVPSILVESQRQNLITYPRSFGNAYWIKTGATVVGGLSSPFVDSSGVNTLEGFKLVEDTSTGIHSITSSTIAVLTGQTLTLSIRVKKGENNHIYMRSSTQSRWAAAAYFNLNNGTKTDINGTSTINLDTDGYYLIRITGAVLSDGNVSALINLVDSDGVTISYTGDGTSGVYICHAQLEQASSASSPIYGTEGSALTRNADYILTTQTGILQSILDNGITIFAEFENIETTRTSSNTLIAVGHDAAGVGTVGLSFNILGPSRKIRAEIAEKTLNRQAFNSSNSATIGKNKIAIRYNPTGNLLAIFLNGTKTEQTITPFTEFDAGTPDNIIYGNYTPWRAMFQGGKFFIVNSPLSDSQLEALTTL